MNTLRLRRSGRGTAHSFRVGVALCAVSFAALIVSAMAEPPHGDDAGLVTHSRLVEPGQSSAGRRLNWVGSWSAPPVPPPVASESRGRLEKLKDYLTGADDALVANATVRSTVTLTAGGNFVRIRLSNAFGTRPLEIGGASLAPGSNPFSLAPGSLRRVTFGGASNASVPPGATIISDPVALSVGAAATVTVSLYLTGQLPEAPSQHAHSTRPSLIVPGNAIAMDQIETARTVPLLYFLSGVDVAGGPAPGAIAVLGDSLTDGGDGRWPALLARRLEEAGLPMGVLNQAIAGNRIAANAPPAAPASGTGGLSRFDRDVIGQSGVRHLIVFEGINDLGASEDGQVTADDLISVYEQIVARAHEAGITVHIATLTPSMATVYRGYATPYKDRVRNEVNAWIRSDPRIDSVIDIARIMSDPKDPSRLNPAYDIGDHLHINGAGQEAIAAAFSLQDFSAPRETALARGIQN